MNTTFRFSALLAVVALFVSCAPKPDVNEGWESFGDYITAADYVALDEVIDTFSQDAEVDVKISGTLKTVCQSKGCWTIMETADGRNVRMTFANYSFFLPTDAAGREIIAEGLGFKKESSVEEQRHYLEDANASEEEILAITEPKIEYSFEAKGVLLR